MAIQFPLDRCPLHKESITLSSLFGKEEAGLGIETAWTGSAEAGCLLRRTEASRRYEGKAVVCQQLLEENSMFTDPSDSLQNTSKHFTDIVSFILPQSHVFPSKALAHGATERWPSKITTRDGQSCQGRTEPPRALTLSHQLPSQQWESSWAEKAKKGPL